MVTLKPTIQAAFCALLLCATAAYAQAPFYQGKTLTIVHGRDAGGSGDFRVRAVGPFLHKYIPGNPTIVHEYMDGGGGRKAANALGSNEGAELEEARRRTGKRASRD